jgi:nucleotide-binding universal stress UspA family protein
MSSPIVVGVDGREGGRDALALARVLQRARGGELVAVHAHPYELFVARGEGEAYDRLLHEEAQRRVEAELDAAGVEARALAVPDGSPARALQLAAERQGAGLVVVGSAHRGPLGRLVVGDGAAGTLHAAPCAVAVAPRGFASTPGALREIGVGFDGEPEARAALASAEGLADAAGARLHVIVVARPAMVPDPWIGPTIDWTEQARAEREYARRLADDAVAELGVPAAGEVLVGSPGDELAAASRELDLIVVGSRRFGPARRLLLGSTSSHLVRAAACPVVVLPRGAREPEWPAPDVPGPVAEAGVP